VTGSRSSYYFSETKLEPFHKILIIDWFDFRSRRGHERVVKVEKIRLILFYFMKYTYNIPIQNN